MKSANRRKEEGELWISQRPPKKRSKRSQTLPAIMESANTISEDFVRKMPDWVHRALRRHKRFGNYDLELNRL